jgi:hypothetical protein
MDSAPRISVPGGSLTVTLLPRADYYRFTSTLCSPITFNDTYTFEEFIEEKRATEDQLRAALSRHWQPGNEFEVGVDTNHAFTLCGGLYSARCICLEYLETLFGVLRSARMWRKWSYATAVELDQPVRGMTDCDFVLQGEALWVLDDHLEQFDFVQYFSRAKPD